MLNQADINRLVAHWALSAEKDHHTMLNLMESNDYSWAMFLGHIVIEKSLKALIVKHTAQHAPFSHDLLKLANLAGLSLTTDVSDYLDAITLFNINASCIIQRSTC